MRISIKGKQVTIADDTGVILIMTTAQLLEMVRILNAFINQDGCFIFEILEFKV